MSASTKKKLRHEQAVANEAQKKQTAKKESDKMKLYTIIFAVVVVFMIAVVLIAVVDKSGLIEKNTTAAEVGEYDVSAVEMNIFYIEAVNEFFTQYQDYISMFGLDAYTALDQQTSVDGTQSWADYFTNVAVDNAHTSYALYNAAMEAGFALPEDSKTTIDSNIDTLTNNATSMGYSSTDKYVSALYGPGTTVADVRHVMEVTAIADAYYSDVVSGMTFTDDELAAKEAEDPIAYNYYSYSTYMMYWDKYLEGGTEDEEGNITYSDEENAAAMAACLADAEELVAAKPADTEELDALIAALPVNKDQTAASIPTVKMNITSAPDYMVDWLTDESRQNGDITYIERYDSDNQLTGYSVVLFVDSTDNNYPLANVRHILVIPSGGTYDSTTGTTTYNEAEMSIARTEAQAILDEWKAGEATEESFAALATQKTDDTASAESGGLYSDIYYGQTVANFNDWCFAEGRKPGDTGLVDSEYGVHVMYYVGGSETTQRDHLVEQALLQEHSDAWYNTTLEASPLTTRNLHRIKRNVSIYGILNVSGFFNSASAS